MKIAILGFTKISYMPYLHFYLNQINTEEHDVSLIYWQRDENPDSPVPNGVCAYPYCENMSDGISLYKKLPKFYGYRRYAIKKLKEIKPDFLIILHSTTGITVLDYVKRHFKKKYIFDYRDVTYEGNSIYRKMVGSLVEDSVLTFTSSDGFRRFLPDMPHVFTSHNLTRDVLSAREELRVAKKDGKKIKVGFWGLLRNYKVNERLIEALGGDDRFELHYYGRAQDIMLDLINESVKKHTNVFFHGEYKSQDRISFAKETDIIHNAYNSTDRTMHYAMANKYYDGIVFYLPQLCTADTFMGQTVTEHNIGFACDVYSDSLADDIYNYYTSVDREKFVTACDAEFERIMREVEEGEAKIKEVLDNANKQLSE